MGVKMLTPYDLGSYLVVENCDRLKVDELVAKSLKELKKRLVQAQIEALGVNINLITSRTRFNGQRIWFQCPHCKKRIGTLYKHPIGGVLGCRVCLNLKYKRQRFKV